MPVDTK